MMRKHLLSLTLSVLAAGTAPGVRAEWLTQSIPVRPGWSAVYLHVDATYQDLDQLVGADLGNPIEEIWLWQVPATQIQFVTSPQNPITGGSQWLTWSRGGSPVPGSLRRLLPNAAYLIRSRAAANYTWELKGRPVPPSYSWTSSGLNFIGFPTLPGGAPSFQNFLNWAPALRSGSSAEIHYYPGGELEAGRNPATLLNRQSTPVTRGEAYWIRSKSMFNNYFGPFQLTLANLGGVDFGDSVGQYSLHLRNVTATNVTVRLTLLESELPPDGQPTNNGAPPLLVRGALNSTNLTYDKTPLPVNGVQSWTLEPAGKPGAEIVVVLGLNRHAISDPPGTRYAGVLRFTDSLDFTQVDVAVSAVAGSYAGLWVGEARLGQVATYLKEFQKDGNGNPVLANPTNLLSDVSGGRYVVTGTITTNGPVARGAEFPLRLIVHNDGSQACLLQRVFYGLDADSNPVIATDESALDPARRANARRVSSIALPWSATNATWTFTGRLAPGESLTTEASLRHDDAASNPFIHTYHPDHDNLDERFAEQLGPGSESYRITRQITLSFEAPGDDFGSLTQAEKTLAGAYEEQITLEGLRGATRTFETGGIFALNRVSPIATLTRK